MFSIWPEQWLDFLVLKLNLRSTKSAYTGVDISHVLKLLRIFDRKNRSMKGELSMEFTLFDQYLLLRKKKGIKLKDIAEYMNVSISLLSLYENEWINLSYDKVKKYRKYIDRH